MDDVDDRVKEILEIIADGEWGPQRALEYAAEQGVTYAAVKNWAAQAFRVRRFLRGTSEDERERLTADLDYAARRALTLTRTFTNKDGDERLYDCPDINAYIKAKVELAKLLRLDKPEQPDGDEPVPVEQLAAALRALGHEVKLNVRSEPAPPSAAGGAAEEGDTERPGKEREEGFLEGDDE